MTAQLHFPLTRIDLTGLSVKQIRFLIQRSDDLPEGFLKLLQSDGRAGVKQISRQLARRRAKIRAEKVRLDRLMQKERLLWETGLRRVAGMDEAGMGPLAGPVIAAAVIFRPGDRLGGVADSKAIPEARRGELAEAIRATAMSVGIGKASVPEIDRLNIYHAGLLAMQRALAALQPAPEHVLVDGRAVPGLGLPQSRIVKGDRLCFSIAAASILAKTERDRIMEVLGRQFPEYGFGENKGYPTPAHQSALARWGPCPAHRRSFPAVADFSGQLSPLYYELRGVLSGLKGPLRREIFRHELKKSRAELHAIEYRRLKSLLARSKATPT